ncbi:fatty acid--CoA ligase family protein [Halioxenophilus sp. WMMB6]|uniref:class I adenylate-forming enzyme family protein n=1 Tax=Halioxenophilus sp. WMMB6 TaxID=3073815 RepID=UPI00295ED81D|nr:fatty acid--CoA ligase family protein [Halioxenophilus sp. WMMB6]
MKTLQQLCAETLLRDVNRPVVEFEGNWFTWGEMRKVSEQLLALLTDSGVPDDAPVTFVPRNRPSALAALMALMSKGRNIHMLYAFQSPASLARQIEEQKPAVVVAGTNDFSPEVTETLQRLGIAGIAIDEMQAQPVDKCERSTITSHSKGDEPYIQILTSGTTGTPKQFPITYALIGKWMVGENLLSGQIFDKADDTPTILFFPIGNITGIYTTVPALVKDQRIVLLDRFNLERWHDYVVRYRPSAGGMAPAALQMLLDAKIPKEDLASLKTMGVGAAPLDPTVQRNFEERYQIPILLSYGATEFAGPVTAMTGALYEEFGKSKFGSVGRVLPGGFKIRVVHPESYDELPIGEEGLLEVVSPRIGEHWIRTSDIGLIDADGFLFICGRADGAIMRGGFKVLPETIEKALLQHPDIAAVSVVGIPDQRLTEVPGAAIQVRSGHQQPSIEALEKHIRDRLLATHVPVHWRFVDALPKTPSFKVHRPAVKALFS